MTEQIQSVHLKAVGQASNANETPAYRHPDFVNGLKYTVDENIRTVQDLYLYSCQKYKNKIFLGQRAKTNDDTLGQYQYKTYGQCLKIGEDLGKGIKTLKLDALKQEFQDYRLFFVGVYSKNREEWVLLDIACSLFGMVTVPMYDTLGVGSVEFILEQTGLTTVFCTDKEFNVLIKAAEQKQSVNLKNVVIMNGCTQDHKLQGINIGLRVYDLYEVVQRGQNLDIPYAKISPENIYTFSYTSGTTNVPKAAMLTHQNLISTLATPKCHGSFELFDTDIYLSYLPLTHIFERFLMVNVIYSGCQYVFYNGDVQKLKFDFQDVKPTAIISVPRILNRYHQQITEYLNNLEGIKKSIGEKAVAAKMENYLESGQVTHMLYDSLIFSDIKDILGGRIRFIITGSAPISPHVLNLLKISFCCTIIEGYGQTETSAGSCLTRAIGQWSGSVGGPTPNTEVKLVSIPEMEYTVQDKDQHGKPAPRGEILFRGYGCIKEYYKAPDKTAETVDSEGWIYTGDVGQIKDGRLIIIDRKKNVFKLSQGEYVAPEKIQNVLVRCDYIAEAYVHGESLKDYLVLIAVPKVDNLLNLAKQNNIQGSLDELCMLDEVNKFCRKENLNGLEIPRKIYLQAQSFQTQNLLTPTFKMKRNEAKKYFEKIIEELYSS